MKRPFSRILMLVVSLLIGIFVMEASLRIITEKKPEWSFYHPRYYLEDHPILGFTPTPRFSQKWKGFLLSNNSDGFRSREHEIPKPQKKIRVLGLGNSQTWGAHVPMESTYLNHLSGGKFEVIMAGVPGYASDQSLTDLKIRGTKYQPDIVILALFLDYDYGEIPRLVAHHQSGLHRIYKGLLVRPSIYKRLNNGLVSSLWEKSLIFLNTRSYLFYTIQKKLKGDMPSKEFAVSISRMNSEEADKGLQDLLNNLNEFRSLCADRGAWPLLLLIPSLRHALAKPAIVDIFNHRIVSYSEEIGLPTLDLHAIFLEHLSKGKPLYFPDNHLSPVGHQLVGEVLMGFLNKNSPS